MPGGTSFGVIDLQVYRREATSSSRGVLRYRDDYGVVGISVGMTYEVTPVTTATPVTVLEMM